LYLKSLINKLIIKNETTRIEISGIVKVLRNSRLKNKYTTGAKRDNPKR
jgi:hypothetical protein